MRRAEDATAGGGGRPAGRRPGAGGGVGVTTPTNPFAGRRVLVTGHTGFKGAWLALWLGELGAEVHGLSLPPPTSPSLYADARVRDLLASEATADVRDAAAVEQALTRVRPVAAGGAESVGR